jgi:F-type H+-transporting ATPase subunit epsilon
MTPYLATVITPQGKLLDEQIEYLSAPAAEGYLGVMAHHAPMVAMLSKGILKTQKAGTEQFWAINSGVLEVNKKGEVLVLADNALPGNSMEEAQAKIKELT